MTHIITRRIQQVIIYLLNEGNYFIQQFSMVIIISKGSICLYKKSLLLYPSLLTFVNSSRLVGQFDRVCCGWQNEGVSETDNNKEN